MKDRTPVYITQIACDFEPLLDLYIERSPKKVLEIGTHHGGTLYWWITKATEGTTIVSLDNQGQPIPVESWKPENVEVVRIKGDSHKQKEFDQVSVYAPFDFIFIDGDHSYEGVKKDWNMYSPLAAAGAIIAFHDIFPHPETQYVVEVDQFWNELKSEPLRTIEFGIDGQSDGIGVVFL